MPSAIRKCLFTLEHCGWLAAPEQFGLWLGDGSLKPKSREKAVVEIHEKFHAKFDDATEDMGVAVSLLISLISLLHLIHPIAGPQLVQQQLHQASRTGRWCCNIRFQHLRYYQHVQQ
jgi:hypothetical protein